MLIQLRDRAAHVLPWAGAVIVSITGCATTTIDVDVYKGPLANHEDSQTQEIAVMATKAKRVLVQLRDTLAGPDVLDDLHTNGTYKPGFIASFTAHDPNDAMQQDAISVNEVLSLYEDIGPPVLTTLLSEGILLVQDYSANYVIQDPKLSAEKDAGLVTRLDRYSHSNAGNPLWRNTFEWESAIPEADRKVVGAVADRLWRAYTKFLNPTGRNRTDTDPLFRSSSGIDVIDVEIRGSKGALHQFAVGPSVVPEDSVSLYVALSSPDRVRSDARLMFAHELPEDARDAFVSRVNEISRCYLRCRADQADGLTLGLQLLRTLAAEAVRPGYAPRSEPTRQLEQKDRERAIAVVSRLVASLIRRDWKGAEQRLGTAQATELGFPTRRENFKATLAAALVQDPEHIAMLLMTWHQEAMTNSDSPSPYGIAGSPDSNSSEGQVSLDQAREALDALRELSVVFLGNALERGRLPIGLDTLSERFQQIAASDSPDPHRLEIARRVLYDELIRFGDKISYLANSQILLAGSRRDRAPNDASVNSTVHFARILQSVGNAILTFVDEQHHRASFEAARPEAGRRESRALASVTVGPCEEQRRRLLDLLQSALEQAERERDALSGRKTRLEGSLAQLETELNELTTLSKEVPDKELQTQAQGALELVATCDKEREELRALVQKSREALAACGDNKECRQRCEKEEEQLRAKLVALKERCDPLRNRSGVLQRRIEAGLESTAARVELARLVQEHAVRDTDATQLRVTLIVAQKFVKNEQEPVVEEDCRLQHVVQALRNAVLNEQSALKGKTDAQAQERSRQLETTLEVLSSANLFLVDGHPDVAIDDPRDVLDEEIAKLRYEYLESVKVSGAQTIRSRNLRAALDVAERFRTDMVFLRPPAAFLRNSYPVTSLQGSARVTWRNELDRMFWRTLPILGGGIEQQVYDTRSNTDVREQLEIDQQYWQNINRVRVTGAGFTNYVMVKDDVGNWYVKNFSADPSSIIEGVSAAMLYKAGIDLGTTLLGDGAPGPASSGPISKGFNDFKSRHKDATAQVGRRTAEFLDSARNDLEEAWLKDATIHASEKIELLKGAVERAWADRGLVMLKTQLDALVKDDPKGELGKTTIDALRAADRAFTDLASTIERDEALTIVRTPAILVARRELAAPVATLVDERQADVRHYATELSVLIDAMSAAEKK